MEVIINCECHSLSFPASFSTILPRSQAQIAPFHITNSAGVRAQGGFAVDYCQLLRMEKPTVPRRREKIRECSALHMFYWRTNIKVISIPHKNWIANTLPQFSQPLRPSHRERARRRQSFCAENCYKTTSMILIEIEMSENWIQLWMRGMLARLPDRLNGRRNCASITYMQSRLFHKRAITTAEPRETFSCLFPICVSGWFETEKAIWLNVKKLFWWMRCECFLVYDGS